MARGYGETVPQPVRRGITNLRNNWRLPGQMIQYGLQGRGTDAAKSTTRFAVNTLFGLGGLLDIGRRRWGCPTTRPNFDETFYRWGIPEGGYLELPVLGPGTQRDWTGYVLDQLARPDLLRAAGGGDQRAPGARRARHRQRPLRARPGARRAALRVAPTATPPSGISYLQNMRARLQGGTDVDQLEDVYAEQ